MTYKKIVQRMLEEDAYEWVRELLTKNGYKYRCLTTDTANIEHDKESDAFLYDVKVHFYHEGGGIVGTVLIVGGTVNDLCGISHSVIWGDPDREKIVWMARPETRADLGIKDFTI